MLPILKAKDQVQVATTIFCSSFWSLSITKEFKDMHVHKHPSISSERINFVSVNSPFEAVEALENQVKPVEGDLKTSKTQSQASSKQWSTATQKADELKSKVGNLESRVAKLEKNEVCRKASLVNLIGSVLVVEIVQVLCLLIC